MSFEKSWAVTLIACSTLFMGCSADSAETDVAESPGDEVVGVTDLSLVEKTFGLERDARLNGAWSRDVARGACFAAYAAGDSSVQYRRYKNGAAFFRAEQGGDLERTRERPLLCVDLDHPQLSLDGVGLDAVFRLDLGKPIATDSAPGGEVYLNLERGRLHVLVTDSARGPSRAQVTARRNEHGASLVESPLYIGGELLDVTVAKADVFEPFSGETTKRELMISGSLAAFTYAAAYAKAGSAFSLSRDPLGALGALEANGGPERLRAEAAGDGPGWWQALYFPIATLSEGGFYDGGMGETGASRSTRTFRVTGPSIPGGGYVANAGIECELVTVYRDERDTTGTPKPIVCKGL
jgi:hypothetical protein